MKQSLTLIILAFMLYACHTESAKQNHTVRLTSCIEVLQDTVLLENLQVIPLKVDKDEALVASIDHIIEHMGRYYILDKKMNQVLCYHANGTFSHAINAKGNGPGEYTKLMDMTLDREVMQLVLLAYPSTLLYYDLNGKYIQTKKTDSNTSFHALAIDKNYMYLSKPTYYNNQASNTSITVINRQDPEKKWDLLTPLSDINPNCNFRGRTLLGTSPTVFTRKFDNTIYQLEGEHITSLMDINWNNYEVPENKKDNYTSCTDLLISAMKNNYVFSISDIICHKNRLLFKTNLSGLFLADHEKRQITHVRRVLNAKYNLFMPNYTYIESCKNKLCFIFPPHELVRLKQSLKTHPDDEQYPNELKDLLAGITDEPNPIIFCYELKDVFVE